MKHVLVHFSTTLQPWSVQLLLALLVIFGFNDCISDMTQAYLQSTDTLERHSLITKLAPEFQLQLE